MIRLRWTDPVTGRDRKLSAKTRSRDKANREAAKLEERLNAGTYVGESPWELFRSRLFEEHLSTRKATTQQNYFYSLNRLESDMGKPRTVGSVTSDLLSRWAAKMRADKLREASIASNLRYVRSALSWAHKIGIAGPVPQIVMPSAPASRGRSIGIVEMAHYLAAVRNLERDPATGAAMVRLCLGMWLSGLRLSEALTLSWDASTPVSIDIDSPIPMISFNEQKNGKVQRIPATPDFVRFLRRHKPCGDATNGVAVLAGLVFPVGMVYSTVASRLVVAGQRSGVRVSDRKHVTAHDLRRTFGVRWALRVHPLVLKSLMRHSTIETTLRYYVSIDEQSMVDALWQPVVSGTKVVQNRVPEMAAQQTEVPKTPRKSAREMP